jgi:hypothetical protein
MEQKLAVVAETWKTRIEKSYVVMLQERSRALDNTGQVMVQCLQVQALQIRNVPACGAGGLRPPRIIFC